MISVVNMSPFSLLPLEMLLHIFSFIDIKERFRLRVVCQAWQYLLIHPVLLHHIMIRDDIDLYDLYDCLNLATHVLTLDIFNCSFDSGFSPRALDTGKFCHLKRLSLRLTDQISTDAVIHILEETTSLQELDVTLSDISDDVCDSVCKYASQSLIIFKFSTCSWPLCEANISKVLQTCTKLHTLGIGGNMPLQVHQMREILSGMSKKLRRLVCFEVSDSFFKSALKEPLQLSSTSCLRLCVCDSLEYLNESTKTLIENLNISKCGHR